MFTQYLKRERERGGGRGQMRMEIRMEGVRELKAKMTNVTLTEDRDAACSPNILFPAKKKNNTRILGASARWMNLPRQ